MDDKTVERKQTLGHDGWRSDIALAISGGFCAFLGLVCLVVFGWGSESALVKAAAPVGAWVRCQPVHSSKGSHDLAQQDQWGRPRVHVGSGPCVDDDKHAAAEFSGDATIFLGMDARLGSVR